jgi:phage/plasmid-like protein (TIGR03299 family)
MLEAANLDWSVETVPLIADYNGTVLPTGHSALIRDRDSRVLDVITEDWHPTQNIDAFNFFNDFVAAGDMEMHTAGSLRDGNIVWALAKVNESFELFGGKDRIDSYLHFTNPHQYGKSIDIRMTGIRVCCANTLQLSLNSKSKNVVKVSHRRKFEPDEVKETLGVAKEKLLKYKEIAEYLSTKRHTNEDIVDYFTRVFPVTGSKKEISKNAELAQEIMYTQPGAEFGEGTFWNLFNCVTFMQDHVIGRNEETRTASAWYGEGSKLKVKALELATEMAA